MGLPGQYPPTVAAIYEVYEASERQTPRRTHLGASSVGQECARAVWYAWRWAYRPDFPGRLLRLFRRGHREEPWLVSDLRRAGAEVSEVDENGKQWRYEDASLGGHLAGSIDGAITKIPELAEGEWALFECKTSSGKRHAKLVKKGVRASNPQHFNQMQLYMGWSGLRKAAYFSVNKDTDAIYLEVVDFEPEVFERLRETATRIIKSPVPTTRISDSPMPPPCCYCDAKPLCHGSEVADVNCRTCVSATPVLEGEGGQWRCDRHGIPLSPADQQRACDDHLFIPALVPHSDAVDGDDGHVLYQIRGTERRFVNVTSTGFPALDVPHLDSPGVKALEVESDEWDLF